MALAQPFRFEVTGHVETAAMLRELPKRVELKATKAGVNAALTPFSRAAKAKAPRQSGTLKKAITRKVKVYGRKVVVGLVGVNKNASGEFRGRRRVPNKYLHLVTMGTSHSKANDFLNEAYRATKGQAAEVGQAKMREVVLSEAGKLGKL